MRPRPLEYLTVQMWGAMEAWALVVCEVPLLGQGAGEAWQVQAEVEVQIGQRELRLL